MWNTLPSSVVNAPQILAGRMQKAVILGSLRLLRAHDSPDPVTLPHGRGNSYWLTDASAPLGVSEPQKLNDVRDIGDFFIITVINTKNKVERNFKIVSILLRCSESMWHYEKLKPHSKFFVQYIIRECTKRPVGKNMFGIFPRKIGAFFNLEKCDI
ncbi:hypothetical protein NQ317_016771 [Molorchus minor]|uniref:Uncharacterized protein n=1 Tax=Molorchus minor TaxID=1323400 RepID=A0ABQ9JMM3_9CUCU|nr:hypothetical protein NQ317_016771 [Molorchus minor]